MSCFDVQILDPNINTIEIETCIGDQPASIDILTYDNTSVIEVNHCIALLPSEINDLITVKDILGGSGINVSDNSGIYTVSLSDPIINSSDIVDLLEAVQDIIGNSGLASGNYININYDDNTGYTTISATGLQPSGNYSVDGHTHTSSNITDFNSSVSGLLPVKNISAGSGIGISSNSGDFTVSVTGTFGLTGEQVDDRVNDLLKAGSYINLNYNDLGDALTISVTGLQPSGDYSVVGHSHVIADVSGLQNALDGKQPSGVYASGIHYHLSSDITDFNSAVSGLIPPSNFTSLTGLSGIAVTNSGTNYFVALSDPTIQLADITDLSSNARTFLLTPSSSNLNTLISDETGSGNLVFNTSPSFSGTPTVPTAPSGTNSTQIASTAFVRTEISNLVDSSPSTLDTLNELAAALGDDPNFATTIASGLGQKANLSGAIFTGPVTIPSGTGNFNNLSINNIPVSVSGHIHSYTDITNFASGVEAEVSTLLVAGNYVNINYDNLADTLTISATGLQPSGNYSVVGHTHISSDITDFNNAVSGLLPVKDIVGGSGINISSLSGTYTVAVTGIAGLISEEVDDRVSQLLVAGTGVSLIYNDPSGTLTIDNRHTEVNILSEEPQGFVNRTDSLITFNDSTRTFTIQPAVSGSFYEVYVKGQKVVKNTAETVVLGSGTALNFLHFSTTAPYQLETKTTFFDFIDDVPISYIHWNSSTNQSTFFGEERHGIRMDTVTHKWIHNTFGIQYINGLSIGGYILAGNGTLDSHAQFDISDGVLYQEDIVINVTDDNGINSSEEFVQPLSPIAYIPVYYHLGTTGQWVRDSGSPFALKYNATRPFYNLYSPGPPPNWTIPNVDDNKYLAMWIVATNDINDPILALMGQRQDSSLQLALDNNIWQDINLTNIPVFEFKPLYRLIFRVDDAYTNTPKAVLENILDLRLSIQTVNAGVSQNDHGSLFGLGDDDHPQYVHINDPRTIIATHTFTNGLTISSGLLSATSGNFTSLTVSGTGVSVSGHSHSSSNITDFNSAVSGLLPTIGNSGDNRLLTSTGSSVGINAENNLTFDGSLLNVNGSGNFSSGLYVNNIPVSVSGHSHIGDDIFFTAYGNSFNAATSGNIANFLWGLYAEDGGHLVSYLTPTLDNIYSLADHTHTASNITDFNSSVSGLLPVTNILGGQNITVTQSGTSFTVAVTGSLGLTTEEVDDRVSSLLIAGTGIVLNYDDLANTLNISTMGLQPSGNYSVVGHTHTSSDITDFNTSVSGLVSGIYAPLNNPNFSGTVNISGVPLTEIIDDEVAGLLVAGSGINLSYNDSANTLTVDTNVSTSLIAGTGVSLDYNTSTDELSIRANNNLINSSNLYLWSMFR